LITLTMNAVSKLRLTPDLYPGYRLRRLRGSGGFGEVWEAETEAGRTLALKFLPCARGRGAAQELRSIQVIQTLEHPHLLKIDRVWCAGEFLVVAMELADGSLSDLLEVYRADLGTPLPPSHLLPLLAQAAKALDFLNNRQHLVSGQWVTVQHCDVTPPNLLLQDQTVKLSDFGLVTTLAGRHKVHYRAGTPAYAAPEIFQGQVSDRTDQYALAVCYCLLRGGRLPFVDTPRDFQTNYVRPAPDLSMVDAPERLTLARALATAPQDRWGSCEELIRELEKNTAPPAPESPSVRRENRREPRYQSGRSVGCEVLPTLGNQAWTAVVQNVSSGGVRLRLIRPGCEFKPGRVLELVLTNPASGARVLATLRLAHGVEVADGDYEVGGAFVRALTDSELAELAEAPDHG
jgi:serine/threonine-protein kinase